MVQVEKNAEAIPAEIKAECCDSYFEQHFPTEPNPVSEIPTALAPLQSPKKICKRSTEETKVSSKSLKRVWSSEAQSCDIFANVNQMIREAFMRSFLVGRPVPPPLPIRTGNVIKMETSSNYAVTPLNQKYPNGQVRSRPVPPPFPNRAEKLANMATNVITPNQLNPHGQARSRPVPPPFPNRVGNLTNIETSSNYALITSNQKKRNVHARARPVPLPFRNGTEKLENPAMYGPLDHILETLDNQIEVIIPTVKRDSIRIEENLFERKQNLMMKACNGNSTGEPTRVRKEARKMHPEMTRAPAPRLPIQEFNENAGRQCLKQKSAWTSKFESVRR